MFVVSKVQPLEFETLNYPLPIQITGTKMIGFLPVYETREAALEEYPEAQLMEIRYKEATDD